MKKFLPIFLALAGGYLALQSKSRNTGPNVHPMGRCKERRTKLLEAGAAILQQKSPLEAMSLYLNGFHFYADDMGHQMEAHHYCTQVNEDLIQCVIFDGNKPDALLIGVEYILSEELFSRLPEEEKSLWHSHHYEVASGTLIAPGIPERVEHQLMKKVMRTYGKVWHTWDTAEFDLPVGIPALMMGATDEGQLDKQMIADRDRRFGVSAEKRSRRRSDIPYPELVPGVNIWETGRTGQLRMEKMVKSIWQEKAGERSRAEPNLKKKRGRIVRNSSPFCEC